MTEWSGRAACLIAGVLLFSVSAVGCGSSGSAITIDLIHELPNAERRAAGDIDAAIRVDRAGPQDDERPSILMTAPARIVWSLRFPPHAHLTTAVRLVGGSAGQGVTARIGISDNRIYEQLARVVATASEWQTMDLDLRHYAGFQWSLFYRPSNTTWRLNVSADPTPGGTVAWAMPLIR